jgi:hypothetical protein
VSGTRASRIARNNARLTLFAQLLNIMAGSSFAASIVAPLAATFYAGSSIPLSRLVIAGGVWLVVAAMVHGAAQWLLEGIQ